MKLLVDMNLSPRWVDYLIARGFKAKHWSMVGRPDASDEEIFRHARDRNHVILTHDLDFSAILAANGGAKPSVVQLRSLDVTPEKCGPLVARALTEMAETLHTGALVTIDASRARLRILPLKDST